MSQERIENRVVARMRKERARNVRLAKMFACIVASTLIFVAGFSLRGNTELLVSLGFPPSMTGAEHATSLSKKGGEYLGNLSVRVSEVETVLAAESLDSFDLDAATTASLDAFAASTRDRYLRYYSPERFQSLSGLDASNYSGVGVLFSEHNGRAYVVDVFEGSSAQLEGVVEGDFVVAIDGDRSQAWSRAEVTAALNKDVGSSVVITWRRPESFGAEGGEEYTTTLTCSDKAEPNISTSLEDKVGYIKVSQITANSAALVQRALTELQSDGARSFVLDLRNNPGGYLNQAVDLVSLFSDVGAVVQVQTNSAVISKSTSGSVVTSAPLVVLVNKNTSSAAEVAAMALQESGRATVVGETTMGKGSVQITRELSFGGALRYTAAYYLSPRGTKLDGLGVSPNVTVVNDGSDDRQFSFAIDSANTSVSD
ncbi:S41 family peptidase [Gordonibacter sp. Marseille-P4307]|uniref:S41 family peptidase n=1 Tax=Gordonibacter sp. Marseille-P4307 TaxID=2161815 RepID=UPI000F529FFB|nr:S41 family peptidase [Gordonibacter sp. Marseille-P4307]